MSDISQNLSSSEIARFREIMGLSQESLARELGVSVRTIFRWEKGKTFPSPLAREKLKMIKKAMEILKEDKVWEWLNSPNQNFEGKTPLEAASTPHGLKEVIDFLGKIDWGIPL